MKRLISAVLSVALFSGVACAQFLPAVPSIEKDAKGTPKKMDFSIPLTGISDPGILFSHFSSRPLLIYYFSPKCPHCIQSYPKYQGMVKEFEARGLQGVAISIGGMKKNDIRMFMDQQNVQVPVLQDANRKFSDEYGSGHVPMMILVFDNGQFIRYTENNAELYDNVRNELTKKLSPKK